jgi:hypothetical protein
MQHTGKGKLIYALISLLAGSTAHSAVDRFLPRSPSDSGHPQVQFRDPASSSTTAFLLERGVPGNISACPDTLNEVRTYDAVADITWCARAVVAPGDSAYGLQQSDAEWTYTDKLVRIDEVDTLEYKYRVRTQNDTAAALAGWTASCPIADGYDPLDGWIAEFNSRIGASPAVLSRSDIPNPRADIPGLPVLISKSVVYNGTASVFHIYSNDKYVAVFGRRGTLLGLAHRALGKEFITYTTGDTATNLLVHPLTSGGEWIWLLKMSNSTANYAPGSTCSNQSAAGVTLLSSLSGFVAPPAIDSSGKLTFTWLGLPGFTGAIKTE